MTYYGSHLSSLLFSSFIFSLSHHNEGGNVTKIRGGVSIQMLKNINKEISHSWAFIDQTFAAWKHMEQAETHTWTHVIHITQERELFLAIRKLGVLRKKSSPVYGKRGQCMASELIRGSGLIGEIRSSASPLLLIPATAMSHVVAAVQSPLKCDLSTDLQVWSLPSITETTES